MNVSTCLIRGSKKYMGPLNFIEESLATWYQDWKVPGIKQSETDRLYYEAKSLVKPLMPARLVNVVKHIPLQHQVRTSAIDQEIFLRHCPTMNPEFA